MPNDTQTSAADRRDGDASASLMTAALIGAAIGAGLGLLASRAIDDDDVGSMFRAASKRARRGFRRGSRAAGALGSSAADSLSEARDAVGGFAAHARDAFEDALQREIRQLRKAARRQRRRLGV